MIYVFILDLHYKAYSITPFYHTRKVSMFRRLTAGSYQLSVKNFCVTKVPTAISRRRSLRQQHTLSNMKSSTFKNHNQDPLKVKLVETPRTVLLKVELLETERTTTPGILALILIGGMFGGAYYFDRKRDSEGI